MSRAGSLCLTPIAPKEKTPSNRREIQMFISSLVPWSFPGGHSPDIDDGGVGRFDFHGMFPVRTNSVTGRSHHRYCLFRKDENIGFAKG